jgi:ubiquinone/menaquinone biosynthesis C-methylase UbiE
MSLESYYKDHWVEIEEERLERYEAMFRWSPALAPLLEPAGVATGQVVADFGCGPGYVAVELARRVGEGGRVHAFDINADFIRRTAARAAAEGVADRLETHHLSGGDLPIEAATLDRLITKNVMVYVDDPASMLREFRRVVKPGGKVHVIDSDFAMTMVEAVPPALWRKLLDAAALAFRTPTIGRQLYGLALGAGFSEVEIRVIANPDTNGRMLNFVNNIAGYARDGGRVGITEAEIEEAVALATRALDEGRFLALNPQFMVTATV